MECPRCGLNSASDASFCTECGQRLGNEKADYDGAQRYSARPSGPGSMAPKLSCPRCGSQNALEATHCTECGAVMRADLRNVDTYRPDAAPAAARVAYRPETAEAPRRDAHRPEAASVTSGNALLVPQGRVLFLSVVSFGLYLFYWMFLTWKQYRDYVPQPQQPEQESVASHYPVWHALTLLVPLYGLYRTHAHMAAFRDVMASRGMASSISPGWSVAAVLPVTIRVMFTGLLVLGLLLGPDASQAAEPAAAETLSRGQLYFALAIEVLILAALTWMLVHVQGNINAYWSSSKRTVGTVPISIGEVVLALLGGAAWFITLTGIAGAG